MSKENNKYIPLNLNSRISTDLDSAEEIIPKTDKSITTTDFIYFELENEWLQEYELIYNSYRLEN